MSYLNEFVKIRANVHQGRCSRRTGLTVGVWRTAKLTNRLDSCSRPVYTSYFGANLLWDPCRTIKLCVQHGAISQAACLHTAIYLSTDSRLSRFDTPDKHRSSKPVMMWCVWNMNKSIAPNSTETRAQWPVKTKGGNAHLVSIYVSIAL